MRNVKEQSLTTHQGTQGFQRNYDRFFLPLLFLLHDNFDFQCSYFEANNLKYKFGTKNTNGPSFPKISLPPTCSLGFRTSVSDI